MNNFIPCPYSPYKPPLPHLNSVSPEFPGTLFILSSPFSLHLQQPDSSTTEICCACGKCRISTCSTYNKGHNDPFNINLHDQLASSLLITRVAEEGQFGLPRSQAAGHWTRSSTNYSSLFSRVWQERRIASGK